MRTEKQLKKKLGTYLKSSVTYTHRGGVSTNHEILHFKNGKVLVSYGVWVAVWIMAEGYYYGSDHAYGSTTNFHVKNFTGYTKTQRLKQIELNQVGVFENE